MVLYHTGYSASHFNQLLRSNRRLLILIDNAHEIPDIVSDVKRLIDNNNGKDKLLSGCPICNQSKLERELASILDKQNVKYERLKRLNWLGRQSLDLYLPEYNIAIECQGIQHFKPIDFAGKGKKWANQSFKENKKEMIENSKSV